jgi:hypothetical protein
MSVAGGLGMRSSGTRCMWMTVKKVAVYADAVNLACLTRLKLAQ